MANRIDLATCQVLIRRVFDCYTLDNNGNIRNDFFNLNRAQVRQRFANVNLQEFAEIEANPRGWRMIHDFISRKRPPNTRTNINALDALLREVQYDEIMNFCLEEFQEETDDRLLAFVRLSEMFQQILPYYENKMVMAQEAIRLLECYERQRARLPQFLTEFYVGDVIKEAGIELSRDILAKHRQLIRSLNAFYHYGPTDLAQELQAWVLRCNVNPLLNNFDINLIRHAVRNNDWQGIHHVSNRELSLIDFPAISNLLDADLVVISMCKLGGSSTSLVNLSIILVITSIKAGNNQYDAGSYQIVRNLALLKNQC